MKSIREVLEKIKSTDKEVISDLYIVTLIILVGFSSFGLGRLSVSNSSKEPIQLLHTNMAAIEATFESETTSINRSGTNAVQGALVGSRNGSKYHFPWCSGAQRIKEANKIWFDSKEEAHKAGYTPAANCKGIE